MLTDNIALAFVIIFALRIADVSLGTLRTVYIMQGRKLLASVIGFVEVLIWIFAISQVIGAINDWVLMVAYAGGFAAGTWVGLWLESRFAIGFAQVRIISRDKGEEIAEHLWQEDFGATVVKGHGRAGQIDLVFSIMPRRLLSRCLEIANAIDGHSFTSVTDSRYLFRGYVGHRRK